MESRAAPEKNITENITVLETGRVLEYFDVSIIRALKRKIQRTMGLKDTQPVEVVTV